MKKAGSVFGVILALALSWVAGSMWLESRHPDEQRAFTKPVVKAIGRQASRYARRQAERHYMQTGGTLAETIAAFLDERVPLKHRRVYAYRLARVGSPECVAALQKVFASAPPDDLAFMARLIGTTGNPAAKQWLWPLLAAGNEDVMAGAIHGLSALGGDDVTTRLAGILSGATMSGRLRVAAAAGLGEVGTPAAREALLAALDGAASPELKAQILGSLGRYDFAGVADAFAAEMPASVRAVAMESLAHSSPDAAPFLMEVAGKDADADVRAAAAWALSTHHEVKHLGPALAALAERETEADVRRRLYEAMLPQAELPAERLLPVVLAETDIAARVAGFNALAVAARRGFVPGFDERIVPELQRIALSENSLNIQMRAVFALRRAQTPAARSALAEIATQAAPQIAKAAQNGMGS
jgi:HEAT repeat protein